MHIYNTYMYTLYKYFCGCKCIDLPQFTFRAFSSSSAPPAGFEIYGLGLGFGV
jgi:hypothetical protein